MLCESHHYISTIFHYHLFVIEVKRYYFYNSVCQCQIHLPIELEIYCCSWKQLSFNGMLLTPFPLLNEPWAITLHLLLFLSHLCGITKVVLSLIIPDLSIQCKVSVWEDNLLGPIDFDFTRMRLWEAHLCWRIEKRDALKRFGWGLNYKKEEHSLQTQH